MLLRKNGRFENIEAHFPQPLPYPTLRGYPRVKSMLNTEFQESEKNFHPCIVDFEKVNFCWISYYKPVSPSPPSPKQLTS